MKNAFVTEVGYRPRDRLGYFPQIWPGRRSKRRDQRSKNATSALPITLKAAREVGDIL
jgi:hypothetical protein